MDKTDSITLKQLRIILNVLRLYNIYPHYQVVFLPYLPSQLNGHKGPQDIAVNICQFFSVSF